MAFTASFLFQSHIATCMFSSTDAANVPVKKYGMKVRAFCGVEEGEEKMREVRRGERGREQGSKGREKE